MSTEGRVRRHAAPGNRSCLTVPPRPVAITNLPPRLVAPAAGQVSERPDDLPSAGFCAAERRRTGLKAARLSRLRTERHTKGRGRPMVAIVMTGTDALIRQNCDGRCACSCRKRDLGSTPSRLPFASFEAMTQHSQNRQHCRRRLIPFRGHITSCPHRHSRTKSAIPFVRETTILRMSWSSCVL